MARPCPKISADYLLLAAVRIKVCILKRSASVAARNFPQRRESGFRGIPSLTRWDSASFAMHLEISDAVVPLPFGRGRGEGLATKPKILPSPFLLERTGKDRGEREG